MEVIIKIFNWCRVFKKKEKNPNPRQYFTYPPSTISLSSIEYLLLESQEHLGFRRRVCRGSNFNLPNRGEEDGIRWVTGVGDGGNDRSRRVRGTESSEVRRVGVGQDAVASMSWREGLVCRREESAVERSIRRGGDTNCGEHLEEHAWSQAGTVGTKAAWFIAYRRCSSRWLADESKSLPRRDTLVSRRFTIRAYSTRHRASPSCQPANTARPASWLAAKSDRNRPPTVY